jgi:hypothetical protein
VLLLILLLLFYGTDSSISGQIMRSIKFQNVWLARTQEIWDCAKGRRLLQLRRWPLAQQLMEPPHRQSWVSHSTVSRSEEEIIE